jgi:hypothetical protein
MGNELLETASARLLSHRRSEALLPIGTTAPSTLVMTSRPMCSVRQVRHATESGAFASQSVVPRVAVCMGGITARLESLEFFEEDCFRYVLVQPLTTTAHHRLLNALPCAPSVAAPTPMRIIGCSTHTHAHHRLLNLAPGKGVA